MNWVPLLFAASCVVLSNAGLVSFIKGYFANDPDAERNVVRSFIFIILVPGRFVLVKRLARQLLSKDDVANIIARYVDCCFSLSIVFL